MDPLKPKRPHEQTWGENATKTTTKNAVTVVRIIKRVQAVLVLARRYSFSNRPYAE